MSIVDDKYFRELADEIIKQLIQDFTASYFNCFVLKKYDDMDLFTFSTTLDAIETGEIMALYYSEEERKRLIKECMKRCQHGEVYRRNKNEWVRTHVHCKVNGGL